MLIAAIILALYAWVFFSGLRETGAMLVVTDMAAMLAGGAFVIGLVSYLWVPEKYLFRGSFTAFLVLAIMSVLLILETGGASSPFIALWMVVSIFAGVFGLYMLLPLFAAVTGYLVLQFIEGSLARETIVAIVLAGELPLVVSYLIWHKKTSGDTSSDRAYRELATELSQVAGKAEVVINAIADGVIALDNQGVIQLINPAAQQIIGWGKQDALALDYKSVLKLIDQEGKELTTANDPIVEVLATNKEVSRNNLSLTTNSGKKRMISIVVSPVGQLGSGVIVVFRDITSEKAEERAQAEFISTASHEMRTPVASIEGYLGLALNPTTAQIDDKARSFIIKAHESAQHLGRLFQDLLDVTKADDGRLSNNPEVVDIVAFTETIVQGLRPQAEQKGLHFIFKPNPDDDDEVGGERRLNPVYYANVDNDHLREIIANLVENAIKYTPNGDVSVDISGDADHVVISVADSGIGIPKEDQSHLFQKFYRVDNSDTREIGGTGLGLYLSRRLAEAMSGRIWVESEYKRGSTFYLEIPRIDHEEATRLIESAGLQKEQAITNVQVTRDQVPPTVASPPSAAQPQPLQNIPPLVPQPPQIQPTPPVGEAVYTNSPPQEVARQLQNIAPPQATRYPTTTPQPASVRPQPINSVPQTPSPASVPQQPGQRPNIPLTTLEQDPSLYTRHRPSVSVPPRRQN